MTKKEDKNQPEGGNKSSDQYTSQLDSDIPIHGGSRSFEQIIQKFVEKVKGQSGPQSY